MIYKLLEILVFKYYKSLSLDDVDIVLIQYGEKITVPKRLFQDVGRDGSYKLKHDFSDFLTPKF